MKETSVNTRLATDHPQLIMTPISKERPNTFLEDSFIYAAPCKWNKSTEHIRTSYFDCFKKSVKTMLFTQQYGCNVCMVHIIVISVLITVNYCECILLFSPLNSMYIGYWTGCSVGDCLWGGGGN